MKGPQADCKGSCCNEPGSGAGRVGDLSLHFQGLCHKIVEGLEICRSNQAESLDFQELKTVHFGVWPPVGGWRNPQTEWNIPRGLSPSLFRFRALLRIDDTQGGMEKARGAQSLAGLCPDQSKDLNQFSGVARCGCVFYQGPLSCPFLHPFPLYLRP